MKAMKLGVETPSLVNSMMSNNETEPIVGMGATILKWTDRQAYEVLEVSDNGKRAIIQRYKRKRIDNNGMGDCQTYEYNELEEEKLEVVFRWGSWRIVSKMVDFVKGYNYSIDDMTELFDEKNNMRLVEGKTKEYTSYSKVHILWGVKDEYYDYTF